VEEAQQHAGNPSSDSSDTEDERTAVGALFRNGRRHPEAGPSNIEAALNNLRNQRQQKLLDPSPVMMESVAPKGRASVKHLLVVIRWIPKSQIDKLQLQMARKLTRRSHQEATVRSLWKDGS
jgi:hypothetical protein